jgi:hypothetical protein
MRRKAVISIGIGSSIAKNVIDNIMKTVNNQAETAINFFEKKLKRNDMAEFLRKITLNYHVGLDTFKDGFCKGQKDDPNKTEILPKVFKLRRGSFKK